MSRKKFQVSFSTETESDITDYLKTIKKTERHLIFQIALRNHLRQIGFYLTRRNENKYNIAQEAEEQLIPDDRNKVDDKNDIIHMFDEFHE